MADEKEFVCAYNKEDAEEEDTLEKRRWKNRRWMAWLSLITMVFIISAMVFWVPLDRLDKIGDFIGLAFLSLASVVGFYFGMSTWANVSKK